MDELVRVVWRYSGVRVPAWNAGDGRDAKVTADGKSGCETEAQLSKCGGATH